MYILWNRYKTCIFILKQVGKNRGSNIFVSYPIESCYKPLFVFIPLWRLTGIAGKYNSRVFQISFTMTTMRIHFILQSNSHTHTHTHTSINEQYFYKMLCVIHSNMFFCFISLKWIQLSLKDCAIMFYKPSSLRGKPYHVAAKTSVLESDWYWQLSLVIR